MTGNQEHVDKVDAIKKNDCVVCVMAVGANQQTKFKFQPRLYRSLSHKCPWEWYETVSSLSLWFKKQGSLR